MSSTDSRPAGFAGRWGFGLAVVCLLGGIAVAFQTSRMIGARHITEGSSAGASRLTNVETIIARPTLATKTITLPATIRAFYKARIYTKASGYLQAINVDIGDHVKKGQILAVIAEPELNQEYLAAVAKTNAARATVATAQAAIVHAEKKLIVARSALAISQADQSLQKSIYTRDKRLYEGGDLSTQAFEQIAEKYLAAKADVRGALATVAARQALVSQMVAQKQLAQVNVQVARAQVGQLAALLSYDTVVAPFNGTVVNRFVDPGAFIESAGGKNGTPLLTVVSTGTVRVFAQVPEEDAPYVGDGTEVEITPFGLSNVVIPGRVTRTSASLRSSTRTMTCEVDIANPSHLLVSGMYAVMKIIERRKSVITLPAEAVLTGPTGGKPFVYTVQGDLVKADPVVIGWSNGGMTEIAKGLRNGDQVIVRGQDVVDAGEHVHVVGRLRTHRVQLLKQRTRSKTI